MDIFVVLVYYFVIILSVVLYCLFREKELTLTDAVVLLIYVSYAIAGLFISYGIPHGYLELDETLLYLYASFPLLTIIGALIGKRTSAKMNNSFTLSYSTYFYEKGVNDKLLWLVILFITIYFIGFLFIIRDSIPLVLLLKGEGAAAVKVARLRTTHNLSTYYNIPFVFRYHSIIFDFISYYVFSIVFVKYLNNSKKYRRMCIIYAIVELLICFYATEKVTIIYLIMIASFDLYIVKRKPIYMAHNNIMDEKRQRRRAKRRIRMVIIVGGVILGLIYMSFMGITNYKDWFWSITRRSFVTQSSAVYLQKIVLDQSYGGCLYGKGIPLTIIDSLFGRKAINLSSEIYSVLFPWYTNEVGSGTSGSMPGFYLYSNFGLIISSILVFLMGVLTGFVDKRLRIKMIASKNKDLDISLYSIMILVFVQGYLGSYNTIVSFPFIISPYVLIIFMFTYIIRRITIK